MTKKSEGQENFDDIMCSFWEAEMECRLISIDMFHLTEMMTWEGFRIESDALNGARFYYDSDFGTVQFLLEK